MGWKDISLEESWNIWDAWIRKNLFTVLAIITIALITIWNYTTCDSQKADIIEDCNMYWREKMARMCPELTNDPGWMDINIEDINNQDANG